jgi:RNA-directed DNA polymerase
MSGLPPIADIARIERGFDFLGYHFGPAGLTVAAKTIANFIEKASQLYEQKRGAVLAATALEMYVRRWVRWARSGLVNLPDHHEMQWMGTSLA